MPAKMALHPLECRTRQPFEVPVLHVAVLYVVVDPVGENMPYRDVLNLKPVAQQVVDVLLGVGVGHGSAGLCL